MFVQNEREQPECLVKSLSRRRRIARGSGRAEVDVSNMLASFANMRSKVRDLSKLMKMSGANGARGCSTLLPMSKILQQVCLRIVLCLYRFVKRACPSHSKALGTSWLCPAVKA